NITSVEVHRGAPGFAIYAAMKAALEHLTRTLAIEWADQLIRVNAIAVDAIATEGDEELGAAVGVGPGGSGYELPWPRFGDPGRVHGAGALAARPPRRLPAPP